MKKLSIPSLTVLKRKITQRGNLPHISVQEQLNYVDQLTRFPLGRALIENRSFDTHWTDLIVSQKKYKISSNLEDFILNRSPFVIAWRELFYNFKKITQSNLHDNIIIASIPCGAMRELLDLNFSQIHNFNLIGIDIDSSSLQLAKILAKEKGLSKSLQLLQADAWNLPFTSQIDIISSCGLNIYISDKNKVLELYCQFSKALKSGAKLITGFLTYPPGESETSDWNLDKISMEDLYLENVLFKDLLQAEWRNFRTFNEIEEELKNAGFSEITFYPDSLRVFPIVIAKKP